MIRYSLICGLVLTCNLLSACDERETRPTDQIRFTNVIVETGKKYDNANNDIVKDTIRPERAKLLCGLGIGENIKDWQGKIYSIKTTNNGDAILEVGVGKSLYFTTWNNSLSDIGDETIIKKGTKVFNILSVLKEGGKISFSGRLKPSSTDCYRETSATTSGSFSSPEFLMWFEDIKKLE